MEELVTTSIHHDFSETDHLDSAFAERHLAAAYAVRATARGELFRKAGLGALLAGAGVGLALLGASFLLQPKIITVTNEKLVPGPEHTTERIIEKQIPGPERFVTVTPAEKRFLDDPQGFASAPMRGKIVPSRSDRALSFDDGQDYFPTDEVMAADSAPYVGSWGYCSATADKKFHCFVLLQDGTTVPVPQRPAGRPT